MSKKSGQLHVSTSCDQLHEDLYITSLLAWLISLLRIYELCVLLSAITLNFSAMNKSACCSCNTCSPVGWHNTNINTHIGIGLGWVAESACGNKVDIRGWLAMFHLLVIRADKV